jgi:formylmethanofuran dehydrogenase subunit A
LGPALVNEDLLETALKHLQQGATADLGLMLPGDAQGQATKPILIDLGLYRHLNLSPRCPQDQAKRALRLALGYHGNRLAFSGAGWHLAPVREYPRLFSWLCHREARRVDWQEEISPRCYSVSEWVWMTRTLPAKLLGLNDRGTLQPGARADLALYDPPQSLDRPESLSLGLCRTLLKAGEVVMEDYRLVKPKVATATYYRRSGAEAGPLVKEICQYRSFRPENLWVRPEVDTSWEVV